MTEAAASDPRPGVPGEPHHAPSAMTFGDAPLRGIPIGRRGRPGSVRRGRQRPRSLAPSRSSGGQCGQPVSRVGHAANRTPAFGGLLGPYTRSRRSRTPSSIADDVVTGGLDDLGLERVAGARCGPTAASGGPSGAVIGSPNRRSGRAVQCCRRRRSGSRPRVRYRVHGVGPGLLSLRISAPNQARTPCNAQRRVIRRAARLTPRARQRRAAIWTASSWTSLREATGRPACWGTARYGIVPLPFANHLWAWTRVKVGGLVVRSTCTTRPSNSRSMSHLSPDVSVVPGESAAW